MSWRVPVQDLLFTFMVTARTHDHAVALLETEVRRQRLFISADPIARIVVTDLKPHGHVYQTERRVESGTSVLFEYEVQVLAGRGLAMVEADKREDIRGAVELLFKSVVQLEAHETANGLSTYYVSLTGGKFDDANAVQV